MYFQKRTDVTLMQYQTFIIIIIIIINIIIIAWNEMSRTAS